MCHIEVPGKQIKAIDNLNTDNEGRISQIDAMRHFLNEELVGSLDPDCEKWTFPSQWRLCYTSNQLNSRVCTVVNNQ